jgi:hypothetical protein
MKCGLASVESFVIVCEAIAPNLLDDWREILRCEPGGWPSGDESEDGLFFGLILVCGRTFGDVAFRVGFPNEGSY